MVDIANIFGGAIAVLGVFTAVIGAWLSNKARRDAISDLSAVLPATESRDVDKPTGRLGHLAEEAYKRVNEMLADKEAERRELIEKIEQLQNQVETEENRYRLLRAYANQGLAQSRRSFNTSLLAATLGFVIIISGVSLAIFGAGVAQAVIPIVGGTVINAVSLLFFQQDRRHQRTMFDFFERLREERKLDESLALLRDISDPLLKSRIQATLALHFAQVPAVEHIVVASSSEN